MYIDCQMINILKSVKPPTRRFLSSTPRQQKRLTVRPVFPVTLTLIRNCWRFVVCHMYYGGRQNPHTYFPPGVIGGCPYNISIDV